MPSGSLETSRLPRAAAVIAGLGLAVALWLLWLRTAPAPEPVRIGVLHALSGVMASSEKPLVAAVQLAVREINDDGGLLGRPVQVLVEDTRSDAATAAAAARRLIDQHGVKALFGCWTSACRGAVRAVVEEKRHLLVYPLHYEGLERSGHVIYTGATLNQQALPAVAWATQRFGRRVALLGSEDGYSRKAHGVIRDLIRLQGGTVVAERIVPLGSLDPEDMLAGWPGEHPDLLVSTLTGESNRTLFEALGRARLQSFPLLSLGISEAQLQAFGGGRLDRHFVAAGYLQNQAGPENERFIAALRAQGGIAPGDPVVAAYVGVKLWAAAAREVGSAEVGPVNRVLPNQSVSAPFGIAALDSQTRHLWRPLRIAQVRPDGQLVEVQASPGYVKPAPWPIYRPVTQWDTLLGVAR